ncbi:tRNA pseudouridine(38-40) synthase TruA [Halorientalis sp. IM1011]|uniref:tRNA pseudouridine(38-40) synthase TruA n=1 Tax=Halorientalis sp. IM1011 TaxID=1932360 RepID=UPI00097CC259|nr:tRNA pseudouridine(38-40) synthase TruA [Halorientalis sp. IM1011]AQL43204.1 tRNA pseudouridine(38-40) synthase TruA [Halorientalis sp. IM1011]
MRAYRVAYDGRAFHGFQRQPNVATVSDTLLAALEDLDVLADKADAPPGYAAAGRTDAGVSAVAQTVGFDAPDWLTPRAFDSELPPDVRVWAVADAPADFHATHDATSREYVYHLHAPPDAVDDERARAALDGLRGEHDFHNLTPDEDGTVRDLDGSIRRDGDYLVLRVRAGGFARQLVRRLVALIDEIGRGERDRDAVDRVLAPESLPGPAGVPAAPPEPLVLADVTYPDLAFERDPEAAASAREVFRERRVRHATRARVADDLVDGVGRAEED